MGISDIYLHICELTLYEKAMLLSTAGCQLVRRDIPNYFIPRAAERIFIWGGKDKKGHCNVKKGTNAVHADKYH